MSKLLQATRHQQIESGGIKATRLYTHTRDVAATNLRELAALKGASQKFLAQDSDPGLSQQLDALCPVTGSLELKVGAQVGVHTQADIEYCARVCCGMTQSCQFQYYCLCR